MKTYLDVIEETVQYYSEDPSRRAINSLGGCFYYDRDTDNMCAIGRCLKNPKRHAVSGEDAWGLFKRKSSVFKNMIKPEYKHLNNLYFWERLQDFHDMYEHWDSNGLTEEGKRFVDMLKDDWK